MNRIHVGVKDDRIKSDCEMPLNFMLKGLDFILQNWFPIGKPEASKSPRFLYNKQKKQNNSTILSIRDSDSLVPQNEYSTPPLILSVVQESTGGFVIYPPKIKENYCNFFPQSV